MMKKCFILLTAVLVLTAVAMSQSRETGAIRGIVTDDQGAPLPGVNVTLSGGNLMGVHTSVTDTRGEFRFPALPPGEYQVKAELSGFTAVEYKDVRLVAAGEVTINPELKVAGMGEAITETGTACPSFL